MSELLRAPAGSERRKRANSPITYRLNNIKSKCKKFDIEFDLTFEDIIIPSHCPLLDIPLVKYSDVGKTNKEPGIWSIDRKDSTKGYVKSNVWVISMRANTIKNNATLKELELLVNNLRKELSA